MKSKPKPKQRISPLNGTFRKKLLMLLIAIIILSTTILHYTFYARIEFLFDNKWVEFDPNSSGLEGPYIYAMIVMIIVSSAVVLAVWYHICTNHDYLFGSRVLFSIVGITTIANNIMQFVTTHNYQTLFGTEIHNQKWDVAYLQAVQGIAYAQWIALLWYTIHFASFSVS